jgi:hypothetical protein
MIWPNAHVDKVPRMQNTYFRTAGNYNTLSCLHWPVVTILEKKTFTALYKTCKQQYNTSINHARKRERERDNANNQCNQVVFLTDALSVLSFSLRASWHHWIQDFQFYRHSREVNFLI